MILSVLTSFNKKPCKTLSQSNFTEARDSIIDDISSPVSNLSSGTFWNDIVSKTSALGFTFRQGVQAYDTIAVSQGATNEVFPAPFDSKDGKNHLAAVSALIGVPGKRAKDMTERVFEIIANENKANGMKDDRPVNSLLGTKQLLLRVRDYHYGQQIDRIRIIAEAIRVEYSDDVEMDPERSDLRNQCIAFLNSLDERNTWSSSSREAGQGPFQRGLFKVLVSLACAPVKRIGRDEIYRACELRDDRDNNGSMSASITFPGTDFARELMIDHVSHHNAAVRTESLIALFMLLYQRIDGGIDRSDYILLLQALNSQDFFANVGDRNSEGDAARRCQLTALILAECMSLWNTTLTKCGDDGAQEWIASHPFLSNSVTARNEIEIIGRLLQQELANKILERRRIHLSQTQTMLSNAGNIEDDKIDAPEAIALLTFGLLMKLCHNGVSQGSWASDMGVKGLAVDCVSTANDECGAFGYLGSIMSHLLPSTVTLDSQSSECRELELWDRNRLLLNGPDKLKRGISPLKLTNGDGSDIEEFDNDAEQDNVAVIYASIGREILVATLSAFRSSISRSLSPAKVDNLGMFCQLAAKLHRNSNVLCQRFWMDWESTPQSVNLSEASIISAEQADPLVFLLDIAHSVAISALETLGGQYQENMISVDCGRQEAISLPCISPVLSFLASLIPMNSDAATIFSTFIPQGMIHACLLGVYHVCSKENATHAKNSDKAEEFKRQIEAAQQCIDALCTLSSIAAKENDGDCTEWLRQATQRHTAKTHLEGPALLHAIAEAANRNPLLEDSIASDITSDTLCTISHLCSNGHENFQWICKVGQSFSSVRDDGFRSFAAHVNKVTISFTSLLLQMTRSVADLSLAVDGTSMEHKIEFMKTSANGTLLACDIIASSPQPLDLPETHRSILINAFRTITSSLRIMDGIAFSHESDIIREEAKSVRDSILNALSTSTSLGSNVGFFSTMPITRKLAEVSNLQSQLYKQNDNAIVSISNADEKIYTHSDSLPIESLPAPDLSMQPILSLSREAISLLSAWSDVSEQVALESISADDTLRIIELDMNELSSVQRKALASVVMSLGPARLLFSPAPMCHTVDIPITFVTLLVRYCAWHSECSEDSDMFAEIAIASLGILESTILHAKIDLTSDLIPSFEVSIQSAGFQLHSVLQKLVKNKNTASSKRTFLLVKIMDVVRLSATNYPSLCRVILCGKSNSEGLVELLVEGIRVEDPAETKNALATLACLRALQAIWRACRENHNNAVSTLTKSVHPCDGILRTLIKCDSLVERCISLCDKFSVLASRISGSDETNSTAILHRANLLTVLCLSFDIIEVDALTNFRQNNEIATAASIAFLKRTAETNQIEEWLSTIGFSDSILANAVEINSLNGKARASGLTFHSAGSCERVSTRVLLQHLPQLENKEAIESALVRIAATKFCTNSEYELIGNVSAFGALVQTIERGNFDWSMELARQGVENLHALAENGMAAHLETTSLAYPSSPSPSPVVKCGTSLLTLITACLSIIPPSQGKRAGLVSLFDKVLRSSERIMILANPDGDVDSLHLQLTSISCALAFMNSLQESNDEPLLYEHEQLYKASRLGFCRFVCRTLHDLRYAKGSTSQNTPQQKSEINYAQKNILLSSLSLMTAIAISANVDQSKGANAFQSFPMDLADVLKGSDVLESLSYHLEIACKSAAVSYRQKGKTMLEEPAFEVIDYILTFALVLCESKEINLAELMSTGRFIQMILRNSITTAACEQWTAPNTAAPPTLSSRGYIENSQSTIFFTAKSQYHNVTDDPAHKIWLTTLRVFASLLHSTANAGSHGRGASIRESTAALAIDVLHFYEIPITSFIERCLVQTPKVNDTTNSSTPSSGLGFTVATMHELSDTMSLISELCSGGHRKQFECSSPRLYAIVSNAALAICRSLSSFLGALGTARELFFALNNLNDIMAKASNSVRYNNFRMHPLLADGVPNAKHQAIRNALYANSCCTCMTSEEHSLSLKGRPDSLQDSSEDLEQSFHSHVNNDFIFLMEEIASRCIFSALSVVHKVHPSTSAFVTFTEEEASHLNLSSVPPIGAMVAIRQEPGSNLSLFSSNSSQVTRHGRVIHYNAISKTLDVEYFDNHGVAAERHVGLSRLAALEDISKRVIVFQYKPAPESVSDSAASVFTGAASIGNLILILRWCQQHAQRSTSTTDRPTLELNGIANLASIILGNEIGVHLELDSPTFATNQETKSINSQLLALFDDEVTLRHFDLSASSDSMSESVMLQCITDSQVWKTVQLQLESSLIAARVDQELGRKNAEQAGPVGAQYWGRTTPTGSSSRTSRRSPFT